MQNQVALHAPRFRRCDVRATSTAGHLPHSVNSQALMWSLQHARQHPPRCVRQRCDLVASLPHRHVLCVRCGFQLPSPIVLRECPGSHSSVDGHVEQQPSQSTPTSAVAANLVTCEFAPVID